MSDSDGDSQDSQYQRTSLQIFDFDLLEEKNRQEQRRKKREVAERRKRERERKARRRKGNESDGSADLLESPPSTPPRSPSPPVAARKAIKAVTRIKENDRANKPRSSPPPIRAKKDPSSSLSFSACATAEVGRGILRKKLPPPGSDSDDDDAYTAKRRGGGAGRGSSGQRKRTVTIKEAKITKPRRSRFSQQLDSDSDSDVDPEKEAALQAHFARKSREMEMNRKKQETPPQPKVETFNMNGTEHEYTKTTEEQLAERNSASSKQKAKKKPGRRGRFQEDSSSDDGDWEADVGRRIEENKKRKEKERLEKERLQIEEAAKAMERSRQTHAGAGGLEGMELRIGENGEVELSDIERPGSRQGSQERLSSSFRSRSKGRGDDCSSSVSSEQRPRRGKREGGKKKRRDGDEIKKKYDHEAEGVDDSSVSSREKLYRGEKRRPGTRRDEKAFVSRRSPAASELGRDKLDDNDSAPHEHTPTKRRAEKSPEPESPTAMIEAAKKARCQDSEDDGLWDDEKKPADQMEVDSDDEAIKTKRGIRGRKVGNKARRKRTNAAYASSDDDDDDIPRRPSKDSKDKSKKPAAKRRARKSKVSDSEGGAVKPKKKPGRCLYKSDSDESLNLVVSEEDARKELKPDFANPKLGPPGPLVPFILSKTWAVGDEVAVPQPPPAGEIVDSSVVSDDHDQIPASINRYLQNYQREGVQFVYSSVANGKGCVLGDDMGLGKTVQMLSLIASLLKKTGTKLDSMNILQTRSNAMKIADENRKNRLMNVMGPHVGATPAQIPQQPKNTPILIIVPSSVAENWNNEFKTWGHFNVCKFESAKKEECCANIKDGLDYILIIAKSLFTRAEIFGMINEIHWKLVLIDEYHEYKNSKSQAHQKLKLLRDTSECPLVGMTGTLMQNEHAELFALINLVRPGILGNDKEFKDYYAKPIQYARSKESNEACMEIGSEREHELRAALKSVFLERKKEDVLKGKMTEKNEKVIMCPMTDTYSKEDLQALVLPV